jgi:sulfatase maturation enzyme AslB (radical SAM superfamily)
MTTAGALGAPFYFRRLGERWLATNDWGRHAFLDDAELSALSRGAWPRGAPREAELAEKGFLRDRLDFPNLARRFRERELAGPSRPHLHTVEVTRRCDLSCRYCSASARGPNARGVDMTPRTAAAAADFILECSGPEAMVELTGGEPTLNWPVVELLVARLKAGAQKTGRVLRLSLQSNLGAFNDGHLEFLAREGISLCTSLDGPEWVHDWNRRRLGGGAHAAVARVLSNLRALRADGRGLAEPPSAVCTVTRRTLSDPDGVIDEFERLGVRRVQLAPLDPLGRAARAWDQVGYEPEEFVAFYARALDRLLSSADGRTEPAFEKGGAIFLLRALGNRQWRYPNRDALTRLAYSVDGGVYASDEARLLAADGDESFRLGDASRDRYADILARPSTRAVVLAALPWADPVCSRCAWSPFCRVPAAVRHAHASRRGDPAAARWRCRLYSGVFDLLFERLADPGRRPILESWLAYAQF